MVDFGSLITIHFDIFITNNILIYHDWNVSGGCANSVIMKELHIHVVTTGIFIDYHGLSCFQTADLYFDCHALCLHWWYQST